MIEALDEGLPVGLLERGVSRRTFLKLCAAITAVLALPATYAPRVAAAVAAAPRMPVIWLRGQGCGGETEALLRATDPSAAELLLDLLSIDYHDAFMVSSGAAAAALRADTLKRYPSGYFAVVEGAVPTADDGVHLTVGGRSFADTLRDVSDGAIATIALGSCAFDGGLAEASGGSTGAVGVGQVITNSRLISLPGCPVNVENLTATIVHYLTFKALPATDGRGRPLFAYGALIHNQCGRRSHFEFGEFVQAWGDEGAQKGWCLYKMGCKGPESFANCPSVRYGSGTSWPVRAGAGCIGCTMPAFWDTMSPFSRRLPSPIPFAPDATVDQVGQVVVAGVGALTVAHGAASFARARLGRVRRGSEAAGPVAIAEVEPAAPAEASAIVAVEPEAPETDRAEPTSIAEPEPAVLGEPTVAEAPVEPAATEAPTTAVAPPATPPELPAIAPVAAPPASDDAPAEDPSATDASPAGEVAE